jgi:hypothetical protein
MVLFFPLFFRSEPPENVLPRSSGELMTPAMETAGR